MAKTSINIISITITITITINSIIITVFTIVIIIINSIVSERGRHRRGENRQRQDARLPAAGPRSYHDY